MLDNCFRFAPRDSIPGLIAKICKYLKDHPGWSEEELKDQIKKFISATGVESFNGRTGTVTLDKNDVNNLKIASAYFAEGDESIDSLDLVLDIEYFDPAFDIEVVGAHDDSILFYDLGLVAVAVHDDVYFSNVHFDLVGLVVVDN